MIAKVLQPKNLYKAYRRVVSNKGSAGVDGMGEEKLREYINVYRNDIVIDILNGSYLPSVSKGVEIPKGNGQVRLLGVPTVVVRWLQQAVSQQLMTKFEMGFSDHSCRLLP